MIGDGDSDAEIWEAAEHEPVRGQADGGEAVKALLESDAMTPNTDGTPTHYIVEAENVEYLVGVVLAAARPVLSREALREAVLAGLRAGWRDEFSAASVADVVVDHLADVLTDGGEQRG